MKKALKIGIPVLLIALVLTGYTIYKKQKSKPEWRLDTASQGSLREEVTASGTLKASSQVEVGTEISGTIDKIFKDFNDTVKRGEVLARLDTENLESSLESAQSDVAKAQINASDAKLDLDLQKDLNQKGMGTSYDLQKAQNKYDQAVQTLKNARSALKRADKNLKNAIVTSPIDGVVISRSVEEGQTVAASMNAPTLFIIANNLRKMQIYADVDEADIGKIKVGLPVEFTVDAFADEQFEGTVNQVRLSPNSANNVVTYSVIIDVENPQLKLLPGMTANVTIVVTEKNNVMRIPETAVRFKPSKELWEQFGLKWDESMSRRSFGGNRQGNGNNANLRNTDASPNPSNLSQSRSGGNLPDSIKAKLAGMSPQQRKKFFQTMRQNRPGNPAGNPANPEAGNGQISFGGKASDSDKTSPGRVWILENGKPKALQIVTGLSDGTYIQVISGLREGQQFITGVNYKNANQNNNSGSAFAPGGGFRPH